MKDTLEKKVGHNVYGILAGGGVWCMFYATFLYTLLWMQAMIGQPDSDGEVPSEFENYETVEDYFASVMFNSMMFCVCLAPILGLVNDKMFDPKVDKENILVPITFLLHGIISTMVYYKARDTSMY